MTKAGEYLKGTKRLQIINKWLRGIDDPMYEVYPTRKEGKYILKKRDKPLNDTDNEDENNEEDNKEYKIERQKKGTKDKVKDIDYNKEDEKDEEDNDEEQEDDEKEEEEEQDKLDEDNNEPIDEESDLRSKVSYANEEPAPLLNQRFNPKYNHFSNDLTYINMQILYELQQINEYLKKEREKKEHMKMTKDIINEVMKEKNYNDDINVIYYDQPPQKRRKNNIFADVGF
ncbi:hypothetical protein M9Y10_006902 [Tritrichomonas musculus]|uniref:Uncharacterized protein n=1 Tax=Tritrichomonas musculus TaxID=1915356 RepID=A0ABR2GUU8_9EUKA